MSIYTHGMSDKPFPAEESGELTQPALFDLPPAVTPSRPPRDPSAQIPGGAFACGSPTGFR